MDFDIGVYVAVTCKDGKMIITPDSEGAVIKAAEEFMEREMKVLQKRFEAERVKTRNQMVAEQEARW